MKGRRKPKGRFNGTPKTASELAEALGVSRQLLSARRQKLGDAAPDFADVAAWEGVFAADGREGSVPADLRRKISEQRLRLLRAAADREELRLAKERGETLDKDKVGLAIRQCVSAFWHALDRAAELDLPPVLKGKDEAAIRDELKATVARMKKTIFAELEMHTCSDQCQARGAQPISPPANAPTARDNEHGAGPLRGRPLEHPP